MRAAERRPKFPRIAATPVLGWTSTMLHHALRNGAVAVTALRSRPTLVSRLERQVGVLDLRLSPHMNQGVFAAEAETARLDWAIRSRAFSRWRRRRVVHFVAEQTLSYRRELRFGQRFAIDTRATAVEGRLVTFEQHFLVGDEVFARADVKLIFRGPYGVLGPSEVSAIHGPLLSSPLVVRDWTVVD